MTFFQKYKNGVIIYIKVQPNASRNEILIDQSGVKVYLTSSPQDGKANQSLIRLLAKKWNLKINQFEIVSGKTSRNKKIYIQNIELAYILNLAK